MVRKKDEKALEMYLQFASKQILLPSHGNAARRQV
jgi:hypothetical protein